MKKAKICPRCGKVLTLLEDKKYGGKWYGHLYNLASFLSGKLRELPCDYNERVR